MADPKSLTTYAQDTATGQWYALVVPFAGWVAIGAPPFVLQPFVPPVVVPPVGATSPYVLAPGSAKFLTDVDGVVWTIDLLGNLLVNGKRLVSGYSGLTLYQGAIFVQDGLNRTWWTATAAGVITQSSIDPTKATPAPTWDYPVVAPPPIDPPVTGAVIMPKLVANYPVAATLVQPGGDIVGALARGPVRLGRGGYSNAITMVSGQQLYGMPGTDASGLTITMPDGTNGCVISGLVGVTINCLGHVYGNLFRRISNGQINVSGGVFESNRLERLSGTGLDVNGIWRNNRILWQKRQSARAGGPYDQSIKSPAGGQSINNVFCVRTFQSLYNGGMDLANQGDLALVGVDLEDSGAAMVRAAGGGVIRAFCINGDARGQSGSTGFQGGMDELQLIGGAMLTAGPLVTASGLKRLLTVGFTANWNGSIPGVYTETSTAALLAPLLAPVRSGQPWERPSLPAPPDPVPAWATPPKGYSDSTAAIQAVINSGAIVAPGIYYLDGSLIEKTGQVLIGSGDGVTVFVCTKKQDLIKWVGPPDSKPANAQQSGVPPVTFHASDFTVYGARYGVYANNRGDQLNECTLSHITFRNCTAGFCAQNIYGVDGNYFDAVNFVNCTVPVMQLADSNYSGGETNTMTYIDKTMWHACQFISCASAATMLAKRQNNLDSFVGCIFKGCGSIGSFAANAALLFAQCDMIGSGMINSDQAYVVGCNFSGLGPFLTAGVVAEGCAFNGTGAAFINPGKVFLVNCRPGTMTMAGKQLNCGPAAVGQLLFGSVMA